MTAAPQALLLRDFIHKSLYHPTHGYFSHAVSPLVKHSNRLHFPQIPSRSAYNRLVAQTYADASHGWMTPVELFTPFLSRAVANRIRSLIPTHQTYHIIEIGAGRATLARDILQYWSNTEPALLHSVSYSIIEISPTLAQLQAATLQPWIQKGIATIINEDALQWFHSPTTNSHIHNQITQQNCHIIGMEVLDNLPHDLIKAQHDRTEQAVIIPEQELTKGTTHFSLQWVPQIDPLTLSAMHAYNFLSPHSTSTQSFPSSLVFTMRDAFEHVLGGGASEIWVPTAAFQLLSAITSALPHANLTIADFASFPGASPGRNGPVIQSVQHGSAVVFDSVPTAPFGKVDIMFPTDFEALQTVHQVLSEMSSQLRHVRRVISQQQFFDEFATEDDKQSSTCKDGYNPILQDFANASFLLVDPLHTAG